MKIPTLSDLSKAELLFLISLMPVQPSQSMINTVRAHTLQASANAAAELSQDFLKQLPKGGQKAWEDHKRLWSRFQRLHDEAMALLEAS